ncbi:bifunctional 2-polyprenyl-6-hydroxyphenol methylase/3-demethylubiquinol 3-O-methyltransferase UbiG [Streptomyces sp. Ru87]|uniref:class I SAM-dependent methyltransferase n=1 Tax=Streptomyces sp. Ru87 TaxID=2044307 RepID=UPI000BF4992D|nr:class I SAM-dependent methyltransferase [Streptomyces sp. Ru87]PGH49528.1 SAM-dependent methyltransferase [Streptomyces sp. Ru87]
MATAADHYESLLAEHYTWMLGGDIEEAVAGQADLFRELGLTAPVLEGAAAVDLGCGPGPQTLALASLGFASVTAVDTSARLLEELMEFAMRSGHHQAVRAVHQDIREALPGLASPDSLAVVACMGDTLPHLPSSQDVQELITDVAKALHPGGSFVATYRDLTRELHGPERFIPVRSTGDRILTCFLDYQGEDTVLVHDLVHTRHADSWKLKTSSYPKLRLSPQWLTDQCHAAGLDVRRHAAGPRGLYVLHAVKQ